MMILLATNQGLILYQRHGGEWQEVRRGLKDMHVTSVIARQGVILAGTQDGIYRSDDEGANWQPASAGLTHEHIRWLAYHPQISDFELAGTEPAAVFISRDGGENWRTCPEVEEMRHRFGWYLPYSPQAGCVRGFAHHGDRAYAAVEVGGVLISDDGGKSWGLVQDTPSKLSAAPASAIHPDVHSINTHPSSPDLVYAPTGGGFYYSVNSGASWELLYQCYCRAVWVDPADSEHLVLGMADNVDRNGRIEQSRDGGRTWLGASDGLQVPWSHHMVERFTQVGSELLAVLSNGMLLCAPLETLYWRQILPEAGRVTAVAEMED